MFIKEIKKKNKSSEKVFTYQRLIESYRTNKGPRHRVVLNLGSLKIDRTKWKSLANRIEEIIRSEDPLFPVSDEIEKLARHYAALIIRRKIQLQPEGNNTNEEEYKNIDISSVSVSEVRTIGPEYVAHSYYRRIGMDKALEKLGFSKEERNTAELLVLSRMIAPGSELHTDFWSKNKTGLGELLNESFNNNSLSSLYRTIDRIYENKIEIEKELRESQKDLFNLKEKIILYDLTNTYFEGSHYQTKKITFGKSKEKRGDAPLITIGLLVDEKGFAKTSRFFEGNVSEPKTLAFVLDTLTVAGEEKPVVIMDAGIATEENIRMLREKGFDYICVSRKKPDYVEEGNDNFVCLRSDKDQHIEAKLIRGSDEVFLFCRSLLKGKKERSILDLYRKRFIDGLESIRNSIQKKRGRKRYENILERIGRLKERSGGISRLFSIEIKRDNRGNVTNIDYQFQEKDYIIEKYEGNYYLRSSRKDLNEKELWELYICLTGIEEIFRALKDELRMRPVFHRKQRRIEGHLFITILAYHVLNSIRYEMGEKGCTMKWSTVRNHLESHVVSTVKMKDKSGEMLYIRGCSEPEYNHMEIYEALGLSKNPIPARKMNL
jgi:transposase